MGVAVTERKLYFSPSPLLNGTKSYRHSSLLQAKTKSKPKFTSDCRNYSNKLSGPLPNSERRRRLIQFSLGPFWLRSRPRTRPGLPRVSFSFKDEWPKQKGRRANVRNYFFYIRKTLRPETNKEKYISIKFRKEKGT